MCRMCLNYGGDEWDNSFRMLFGHHPACPRLKGLTLAKKDFIQVLTNMFETYCDRKEKQKMLQELTSQLRK